MTGVLIIHECDRSPLGFHPFSVAIFSWFKILRLIFSLILNFSNYYNMSTSSSFPGWKKKNVYWRKSFGFPLPEENLTFSVGLVRIDPLTSVGIMCFISLDCWVSRQSPSCVSLLVLGKKCIGICGDVFFPVPLWRISFCNHLPKHHLYL